ncbi:MAG: sporulation initiation factor Spo0A C-terminal domain-containing protein [Ruminococcus flavefaciens]|nr:sporulation initiation factor Spo0A C-terminal domain-containing protein [Ruminococcus flavefaciens]
MINTKTNIATTTINSLIKIASHMSELGYYAVSQGNYIKISYNIREYENYCITLYDSSTNIDLHYTSTPVILTDRSDPDRYIIEKDGILYISKYLGEDCICELLKYHLKRSDKDARIRKCTAKILLELGAPTNLNGYDYLKMSIELATKNWNLFRKEIMTLYSEVAECCYTNARCVERSIRTVIESIYYKNPKRFDDFFGCPVGKPRNSELIGLIAEKIRLLVE